MCCICSANSRRGREKRTVMNQSSLFCVWYCVFSKECAVFLPCLPCLLKCPPPRRIDSAGTPRPAPAPRSAPLSSGLRTRERPRCTAQACRMCGTSRSRISTSSRQGHRGPSGASPSRASMGSRSGMSPLESCSTRASGDARTWRRGHSCRRACARPLQCARTRLRRRERAGAAPTPGVISNNSE